MTPHQYPKYVAWRSNADWCYHQSEWRIRCQGNRFAVGSTQQSRLTTSLIVKSVFDRRSDRINVASDGGLTHAKSVSIRIIFTTVTPIHRASVKVSQLNGTPAKIMNYMMLAQCNIYSHPDRCGNSDRCSDRCSDRLFGCCCVFQHWLMQNIVCPKEPGSDPYTFRCCILDTPVIVTPSKEPHSIDTILVINLYGICRRHHQNHYQLNSPSVAPSSTV